MKRPSAVSAVEDVNPRDRMVRSSITGVLQQLRRPRAPEVAILLAEDAPTGGFDQEGHGLSAVGMAEFSDFFTAEASGEIAQEGFAEEVGDLAGGPLVRENRHPVEVENTPSTSAMRRIIADPGDRPRPPGVRSVSSKVASPSISHSGWRAFGKYSLPKSERSASGSRDARSSWRMCGYSCVMTRRSQSSCRVEPSPYSPAAGSA